LQQAAADRMDATELDILSAQLAADRDGWLDLLMSRVISPAMADGKLWVVDHFPISQGLLARAKPDDPDIAERFEVFLDGLELANGFRELTNLAEHETRFDTDRKRRRTLGIEDMRPDPHLLASVEHGLPECSGVAVGLDRLLMLTTAAGTIEATMSFAPGS
jgi:lysyl-tRNA synthetase class 2